MRQFAQTIVAAVVAGALALATAASGAPAPERSLSAASASTKVALEECHRSARAEGRWATFYARMRRVRGTRRMWMRFTLLERSSSGARYRSVAAPGLARWRKSRRGVRRFGYRQTVKGLRLGASYRALIRFRWYDADGDLIRAGRRRSRVCAQRPPRPNLRIVGIGARRESVGDGIRYRVRVLNAGALAAPAARVALSVDGEALAAATTPALAPGEARTVSSAGPPCERGVRATVDPRNAIRESVETDNSRGGACPPVRGG